MLCPSPQPGPTAQPKGGGVGGMARTLSHAVTGPSTARIYCMSHVTHPTTFEHVICHSTYLLVFIEYNSYGHTAPISHSHLHTHNMPHPHHIPYSQHASTYTPCTPQIHKPHPHTTPTPRPHTPHLYHAYTTHPQTTPT